MVPRMKCHRLHLSLYRVWFPHPALSGGAQQHGEVVGKVTDSDTLIREETVGSAQYELDKK